MSRRTAVLWQGLLLSGVLALLSCGGPVRPTSPDALYQAAKSHEMPLTTSLELFAKGAPLTEWQAAFQATPDDTELFEAYAYRQLLRNIADTTVEEALSRAVSVRTEDPMLRFLQAYRMELDASRVRSDQATKLSERAASIRDALRKASALDPTNAFYVYHEAVFWLIKGDDDTAWLTLDQANRLPTYRHPFAAPFPRELTDLPDLIPAMGTNMGIYFQSSPRMFMVHINSQLKQAGTAFSKDPIVIRRVLVAGGRQLEMEPFDLPSYQGAIGLNKSLWEQQQLAGNPGAAAVLKALAAFDEPLVEIGTSFDAAARQLKSTGEDPVLHYGARMLALSIDFQQQVAKPHEALVSAIAAGLPADPNAVPARGG